MKLAVLFATATFSCNASNHGVPGGTLDAGDDPPVQLVFLHEPSNAGLNAVITPEIEVAALDAQGNIAPVFGPVELALAPNAENAVLGGTTQTMFSNGVAAFFDLTIATAGEGYQIVASSPAVTASVASYLFAVFPSASTTRSTFVVDPGAATADGLMPIVAVVTALDDAGAPMPGQPVEISMTGVGADVFPSHGTTDGQGKFTTRLRSTTEGSAVATAMIGSISLTASATFTRAPCTLLFPSLPTLQHETMPVSAVTADFDGDGRVDLAIADGSSVQILRGMGDGRLHPPDIYAASSAVGVAAGDLDGDGAPDLAAAGFGSREVLVFMNSGTGQLKPAQAIALPAAARAIAVGDLDGDGVLDLVVDAIDFTTGPAVLVLRGVGDGSFGAPVSYPLDGTSQSYWGTLALSDVDGDGRIDVVVADPTGLLSVLLASPNGTLQAPIDTAVAYKQGTIAVGDFDRDMKTDVVFSNGSGVMLASGNADGTFATPVSLSSFAGNGVAAGDLNDDGAPDILVAGATFPSELRVLLSNNDGTFQNEQVYGTNSSVSAIAIADFDHDGHADVAIGEGTESQINNSISVLLGSAGGVLANAPYVGDDNGATRAHFAGIAGDFDGNGTVDFVAQDAMTGAWGVQLTGSDGTLTAAPTTVVSGFAQAVGDFDGDGKLDVVVGANGSVSWLRGSGDGVLGAPIATPITGDSDAMAVGDFNGDGNLDLAIATTGSASGVTIALGSGDGTFTTQHELALTPAPTSVTVADLDSDGDLDLVITQGNSTTITVMLGVGDGTFGSASTYYVGEDANAAAVGDFDGDGVLDLVVTDGLGPEINLLRGNGDGTFPAYAQQVDAGLANFGIAAVDVDGDGILDIVADSSGVIVLRGLGGATFALPAIYDAGPENIGTNVIRDLDGDGRPDVMQAASSPSVGLARLYDRGCLLP